NTDRPRMPGKGKKKKGRKGSQRPPTARAAKSPVFLGTLLTPGVEAGESYGILADDRDWYNDFQFSESDTVDPYVPVVRPSLILALLHGATGGEEPADRFWGGPVYGPGSDGAESCGEQPDQESRYSEMDSAGSYDPYLDDRMGDTEYGETEEYSDVCLQSERGSICEKEAPMEVEEYPHRDLPSHGDARSSESKEPPAPKAPPRARRTGASWLTRAASREALLSNMDTPPPEARSSRAYAPTPKPRTGKKAAAPVPEPGQSLLPRLARDTSRQAVCASLCLSLSWSLSFPPATLLALARGRLSGPPTLPLGVGLGAAARSLAKPLTDQLWGPVRKLKWTQEVDKAFEELKNAFATAPVLQQPDPERPFVLEVDASDIGVGTVLSQHTGERGGLRPIAYFSQKLSSAERNYGVGDHELLAMKLTFEDWRHWLEGVRHPFTVYTNHKNLEYLQTTKRLNARQARWSIFFSRFRFKVTYRPGERNTQADALS
ncbi:hypothetical protein P4O66_008294, partial [Electrophorus voltai]